MMRLSHIGLPYWQLAMRFHRIPDEIYMLQKLSAIDLARILPAQIAVDIRDSLKQALMRHNLSTL